MPFAVVGAALFVAGLGVGFVTLRYPIAWLLGFGERSFVEIVTAESYFTFVAYFLLAFGLTFELPLVLTGLVVAGIVSPDTLRTRRASILTGLWAASCVITPGADPYSPVILGIAFTVLFFVTTALVRFVVPTTSPRERDDRSCGAIVDATTFPADSTVLPEVADVSRTELPGGQARDDGGARAPGRAARASAGARG